MNVRPLILVTRPSSGEADPLVGLLEVGGLRVAAVPTIALEPVEPGGDLDRALAAPETWDWIVATSAHGARAVAAAVARSARDAGSVADRWAAVGPATAAVLTQAGIRTDLLPSTRSGSGLADAIIATSPTGRLDGSRVLLPRADAASDDLPVALRAAGARVREVIAYHTVEGPSESAAPLAAALDDPALAAIVLASGSAARGLLSLAAEIDPSSVQRVQRLAAVSIGPSTSAALRDLGFQEVVEASEASAVGLANAAAAATGVTLAATPGSTSISEPILSRRSP